MNKLLHGKRIALIGFGDINHRIAKLLEHSGAEIFAYRRNAGEITLPFVNKNALDVSKSLVALPAFDYVIMTLSPDERSDEAYRKTYFEGLKNVLAALNIHKLEKFFWVSSTSVYSQDDDGWINESSETKPIKNTGRILLEAEALLKPLDDKACVVRFTGIYRGYRHRLINKIKVGELAANVEQDYFTNRIHVDDCARTLVHLLQLHEKGINIDDLYLATDDEPVKYIEMINWISTETGCALNDDLPAVKKLVGSKRVSNARLKDTGFEFKYPSFRQGFPPIFIQE